MSSLDENEDRIREGMDVGLSSTVGARDQTHAAALELLRTVGDRPWIVAVVNDPAADGEPVTLASGSGDFPLELGVRFFMTVSHALVVSARKLLETEI